MGQYSHQSNEERAYGRLREELSEKLIEREEAEELEKSCKGLEEGSEISEVIKSRKGEVETRSEEKSEMLNVKVRVDWYDLNYYEILHLKHGVLQKLVEEGIKKAGTKTKLIHETGISQPNLHEILNKERETITVCHLKDLLDFLEIPYKDIDQYIIGIGSRSNPDSIKYPLLPFNFSTPEGAMLIAAALKDGCISKTSHYLRYANKDKENIERVEEAIKKVFGHIEPYRTIEGSLITITYHSCVIERALEEAGVPSGRKTEQEYHVPQFIREGDEEVQKAYLYQTLMDEGTWETSKYDEVYDVKYNQAISIDKKLAEDDRRFLEELDMKERVLPHRGKEEGYHIRYIYIDDELEMEMRRESRDLWRIIMESKPPNMEEEKEMFEKLFEVDVELKPSQIYYTEDGGYRVIWELKIYGKDQCRRVMEGLNLPLHKHRDKK